MCKLSLWKTLHHKWTLDLTTRKNKWRWSLTWWSNSADHKIKSFLLLVKSTRTKISRLPYSSTVKKTLKSPNTCKTTCRRCKPLCLKAQWAACEHENERMKKILEKEYWETNNLNDKNNTHNCSISRKRAHGHLECYVQWTAPGWSHTPERASVLAPLRERYVKTK